MHKLETKKKFKEDLFDDLNSSPKQGDLEDPPRKTSQPKKRPMKTDYNDEEDDEQTVNIKKPKTDSNDEKQDPKTEKPKEEDSSNTGNGRNESSQRPHVDNTNNVIIYPMLLTFIGTPDSKKCVALNKLVPHISNDYDQLGFSHNQFVVHDFHSDHAEMQYEEVALMKSLKSGNRLMNIWNMGVNRAIIPFLYRFSGHYLLNYMWLFLDLDQDFSQLHIPPVVHDQHVMKWRSRVQYLFRSCHLSKGSKRKSVCKIFATYNEDEVLQVNEDLSSYNSLRGRLAILRRECSNVAEQMGVKELVDIEVIPVNMESNKAEKILKDNMQALFEQLQPKEIPESWMCLRDLLAQHSSTCITKPELQYGAQKCGITNERLGDFCRLFTSFGSILDVQLIDPKSEYIIIKPNEFLIKLHLFFDQMKQSDTTLHGVITDNELSAFNNQCEKKVFMNILCSVGFATVVPNTAIVNDTIIPGPAFYIPSVRTDKLKLTCTRGSIKLVLGMESSPTNVPIKITDYLLRKFKNSQLILTTSPNTTMIGVKILEDLLKIEITSHCDVIEIVSHGKEEKYGVMYKNVCQRIARFCNKMARRMTDQSRIMKYHFAVTCELDRYKEIGYNIYHRRHVLPSEKLCKMCRVKHIDDGQITVWNNILTEIPFAIEQKFRLNGHLSVHDIIALAEEIVLYPHMALHMFAEELEIEHPIEPDVDSIVRKVLNWSDDWQTKIDEAPKKALARKLMNLDAYWLEKIQSDQGIGHHNVNFGLCARQLDIQVYAEYQLQFTRHIDADILLPKDDQDLYLQQKEDELQELRTQLCSAQKRIEELEALPTESSPTQETKLDPFSHVCHCVLGIKDHNVVFEKCMKFQNDWTYIGSGLGISFESLRSIEVNRPDVRSRMFEMLASWLKKDSEYQPNPTWNSLLKTLYRFERIETENISRNFVCQYKQHEVTEMCYDSQ